MTRKDFELIATVIHNADLLATTRRSLAEDFADRLATTNANFKRAPFMAACGVRESTFKLEA